MAQTICLPAAKKEDFVIIHKFLHSNRREVVPKENPTALPSLSGPKAPSSPGLCASQAANWLAALISSLLVLPQIARGPVASCIPGAAFRPRCPKKTNQESKHAKQPKNNMDPKGTQIRDKHDFCSIVRLPEHMKYL